MAKTQNLKPLEKEVQQKPGYNPSGDELKVWGQYQRRKSALKNSRRNVYGMDIDMTMRRIDKNYFNRVANIPASELDADQRPIAINNAFGKVQAALGMLIDRNPEIVLEERNEKYSANRELMKGLAKASWKNTNSLGQLKLSIFNCAKRGWFVGRTYHKNLKHEARFLKSVEDGADPTEETAELNDPEKQKTEKKFKYDTKNITKMDDVAYMNINNYNAWIDEQTVPEDFFSTRDWMWREVMHIDDIKRMFPLDEFPNMAHVQSGGDTRETIEGVTNVNTGAQTTANEAKETKEGMTEIYFYENQYDDWFIVEINGVMVVWEPLPQNSKRLSLVYGYWNLRSAETIYGIGIVEEMERNDELIDRIINMTIRQLLLTIAPPGFYTGTEDPEDQNLKYKPGVLRRTMDPKNITFLEIPQGNKDGLAMIDWLENKQDQMTGITKTLEGEATAANDNPTAFELGVNREAGLKRLRLPLKSVQYALDWEFRNRIDLIKQVYSDFQVEHISNEEEIMDYLDEVKANPEFYFIENEGEAGKEKFYKKNYREMQLNLQQDEKGNFIEDENKKFFKIKPEYLSFEGDVTVDVGSLLVQSDELEKADTLRMANIVVPLLGQDPKVVGRPLKQVLLAFNKDPRKWLSDSFLASIEEQKTLAKKGGTPEKPPVPQVNQPDIKVPPLAAPAQGALGDQQAPKAPTIVPTRSLESSPSLSSRVAGAIAGFRGGKK